MEGALEGPSTADGKVREDSVPQKGGTFRQAFRVGPVAIGQQESQTLLVCVSQEESEINHSASDFSTSTQL